MIQYTLKVKPTRKKRRRVIKKGQTHDFSEIQEKVLFIIIREILSANPNVHFDRDNLYLENKRKAIKGYYIHDGYKISFHQAEIGICLAIDVKNKIKGKFTIYDILNKEDDNEHLIGRKFIPFEESLHQVIILLEIIGNKL